MKQKLEKFSKNKKEKRIVIISIIGMVLLIGGITLYKTFALYEEKKEFNVLKGVVPDYREKTFYDVVNIGDYISYTPSKTSYEITGDLTGCTGNNNPTESQTTADCSRSQIINPSELNLWRVIRKNEDKTIDVVSLYTSSNEVWFYGKVGYENLIGSLNTIAKQYETDGITSGSRHMGYNDQTENVHISSLNNTPPWLEDTAPGIVSNGSEREQAGGGDWGFEAETEDSSLVYKVTGTLVANNVENKEIPQMYHLAHRVYFYRYDYYFGYSLRPVFKEGHTDYNLLYYYNQGQWYEVTSGAALRPIVTLKQDIEFSVENKDNKTIYKIN